MDFEDLKRLYLEKREQLGSIGEDVDIVRTAPRSGIVSRTFHP